MSDDYTIVWNGRGPLTDGSGWQQRESYLDRAANRFGPGSDTVSFPSAKEMSGKNAMPSMRVRLGRPKNAPRCRCGRHCSSKRRRCSRCVRGIAA